MKRFLAMGFAALAAVSMMTGYASAAAVFEGQGAVSFDFEKHDGGFNPIYAHYPNRVGVDEF